MVKISPREREIVDLLAQGFYYKEIASRLGISIRTVINLAQNARRKTNTHNQTELVRHFYTVVQKY